MRFIIRAVERRNYTVGCDVAKAATRREAMSMFEFVVQCGKLGAAYEGVRPWRVSIEDSRIAKPKGEFVNGATVPCAHVLLSQFVDDDEPVGPWAEKTVN